MERISILAIVIPSCIRLKLRTLLTCERRKLNILPIFNLTTDFSAYYLEYAYPVQIIATILTKIKDSYMI